MEGNVYNSVMEYSCGQGTGHGVDDSWVAGLPRRLKRRYNLADDLFGAGSGHGSGDGTGFGVGQGGGSGEGRGNADCSGGLIHTVAATA